MANSAAFTFGLLLIITCFFRDLLENFAFFRRSTSEFRDFLILPIDEFCVFFLRTVGGTRGVIFIRSVNEYRGFFARPIDQFSKFSSTTNFWNFRGFFMRSKDELHDFFTANNWRISQFFLVTDWRISRFFYTTNWQILRLPCDRMVRFTIYFLRSMGSFFSPASG